MSQGLTSQKRAAIQTDLNASVVERYSFIGVELWSLADMSAEDAIRRYHYDPDIEYIEPNYQAHGLAIPSDPLFAQQWPLHNLGQTGGTFDADIDAPEAWDIESGDETVIAVLDSGLHFAHPDLQNNLWTNPGEIPSNGIDDDGNGFIDDIHGYDFVLRPGNPRDNDPSDDRFHGTHVTGILAADGNNGVGIAGVSWSARIMVVKIIDADNSVLIADAIAGLEYALDQGARLSNHSWGGLITSQALEDAFVAARNAGHLAIAGAGNNFGNNNDITPFNPASYDLDNIISVTATDHDDGLAIFSNIGSSSVDLGAAGLDVFSTFLPGADFDGAFICNDADADGYGLCSGTSMSTPHVTGVAALLWAAHPELDYLAVRDLILGSTDPVPSLFNKTATGGRLNAEAALTAANTNQPPVAVNDFFQMAPNTFLDLFFSVLLANDYDPDPGDTLSIHELPNSPSSGGICGVAPPGVAYCPDPGFVGGVVMPYSITDGTDTASANIFITVGQNLLADGFESNDLSAWGIQATNGLGSLQVNSERPMAGLFHLAAEVKGGTTDKAFVGTLTAGPHNIYRARFLVDAGRAKMSDNNLHNIFVARDQSPTTNVAMVQVRRSGKQRQIRARARQNGLNWIYSPWVDISSTTEIDLQWWRDEGSGGGLRLIVDGVLRATLSNLDNSNFQIEKVMMGVIAGVDAGTEGPFYFDRFESFGD